MLIGMTISSCNYPFPQKTAPLATFPPPTRVPTAVPSETPTPQPTRHVHTSIPMTGSGKAQTIHDQVNKNYASQKRAYGGDEYKNGRFERPFDTNMEYQGYLDIVKVTMTRDDPHFIYVTIQVADPVIPATDQPAFFGLEVDMNLDGRSKYLIRGARPYTEDWTNDGVEVWQSTSSDLPVNKSGDGIPVTGTLGFDVSLLTAGAGEDVDLAWIRLSPGLMDSVDIAFKKSLIGGEKGKFVWRPFTDGLPFSPTQYDLQNSFTLEQAGSPIAGDKDYPLKEVYLVDNTCRVTSGYTATGKEPGICPVPPEPDKPDQPGESAPTEELLY